MHTLAHCCLQGVCCAPGSDEQVAELAAKLKEGWSKCHFIAESKPPLPHDDYFEAMARHLLEDNALTSPEIGAAMHVTFKEAMKLKRAHDLPLSSSENG